VCAKPCGEQILGTKLEASSKEVEQNIKDLRNKKEED
jgi:biotin operon repressor